MEKYIPGLVSVVIPTYKRSDLLRRAIDTVLNQTYNKIELLVVNDNEIGDQYSQELYNILSEYTDNRIKLVEQERHINGAAARNAGIMAANGEYIAFQDDDDYWELEKIEIQVRALESLDKSYGAVSCLMRLYKNDQLIMATLPYKSGYILMDILDRKTSMGTGALLIRRESLDKAGYFDESLQRHQDLQLFARLTSKYKVQLIPAYLHNREIKDTQNRPDAKGIRKIKQDYFRSIKDILDSLTERERKKVFIMHNFECAYAFLKSGYKKEGINMLLSILKMPETFGLAIYATVRRIISKKCCNQLIKRYDARRYIENGQRV